VEREGKKREKKGREGEREREVGEEEEEERWERKKGEREREGGRGRGGEREREKRGLCTGNGRGRWPKETAICYMLVWESLTGIWYYLISPPQILRFPAVHLELGGLTSATVIQGGPAGYSAHVSITTPVVSALKSYYII
jgi:hypothetical protein